MIKKTFEAYFLYFKTSSGKNQLPTFLDTNRATLKTTRPAILLLLLVYFLPRPLEGLSPRRGERA
jgi:hypothetical protein